MFAHHFGRINQVARRIRRSFFQRHMTAAISGGTTERTYRKVYIETRRTHGNPNDKRVIFVTSSLARLISLFATVRMPSKSGGALNTNSKLLQNW